MKNLPIVMLSALLLAAPASQLSALPSTAILMAEETLTDATVQQVLDTAAPLLGTTSVSLYAGYQTGSVTITDLGPIQGGNRYAVSTRADYIVVDIIQGA